MTRSQVVAKALDRFDQAWDDNERESWTRLLILEQDEGAELQYDNLDALSAQNALDREQQREAFRVQMEHALDELTREARPERASS